VSSLITYDVMSYFGALTCLEASFREQLRVQTEHFHETLQNKLHESEVALSDQFEIEISQLNDLIESQKAEMSKLKEKNQALARHLHYYRQRN
jgi:hypothetical protein